MIERKNDKKRMYIEFVLLREIGDVKSIIRPVYPVPRKYVTGVIDGTFAVMEAEYMRLVLAGWRKVFPRFVLQDTFVAGSMRIDCLEDILADGGSHAV